MKWLGTTKPLITLADYKLGMFQPIIKKYGWELTQTVSGLYNDRYKELCFNGTLTPQEKKTIRQKEDVLVGRMFVTSGDENIKFCPYKVYSIPTSEDCDSLIKFDQESRTIWESNGKKELTDEQALADYVKAYYFNVLKGLDPIDITKTLNGTVLYGEEPNRHVLSSWLRLSLGEDIDVNDVRFANGEFEYLAPQNNIEKILEDIMKADQKDMHGYKSLRALYLYEQSLKNPEDAELFKTLAAEADEEYKETEASKKKGPHGQRDNNT